MKQSGFNLWLAGWLIFGAIQSGIGADTNALPHFQEVFRLLRANLPNASEAELNQAAVQGLLNQFYPRVILVTNVTPASARPEDSPLSKTTVYDDSYGYLRVARVATGLADQIKSAFEKFDATNKLKGVVLDLRFADGQDYTAAANAADRFLSREQPLLDWDEGSIHSTGKADAINVPGAVLVNRRTTGAAEGPAAALRETDAAGLIGSGAAGQGRGFQKVEFAKGPPLRGGLRP